MTPSSQTSTPSWQASSKFREHLSISLPSNHAYVEKSQFSPESPPAHSHSRAPSSSHMFRRDIESGNGSPRSTSGGGIRDRFTRFFFDMRTFGTGSTRDPELPIQQPRMSEWPPLHIEKRQLQHCSCHKTEKQRRRSKLLLIALIILLLFLFSNVVFLNVRVLNTHSLGEAAPSQTSIASSMESSSSNSSSLTVSQQQCLSQYELNAPANPSSYPCSSCLPVLQSVPANFSTSDPSDGQQVQNAIQFCGLQAVFSEANSAGQSALSTEGWMKDVKFCAWTGVSCDSSGKVSSLQLTTPGVPSSLPNELGALTGLETLQVIGDNTIPAGSLPTSFANLTSLSTLHLESTALTALPDNLFASLGKITTLALVRNSQMGAGLPSSLGQTGLQSLSITSQNITNPLTSLASSTSLRSSLRSIDITSASLTGSIPSSISSFSSLTELLLSGNNLSPPLPSTLPSTLQSLDLSNNPALSGTLTCAGAGPQTCSVQGTLISSTSGCGKCS